MQHQLLLLDAVLREAVALVEKVVEKELAEKVLVEEV